MITLLLMTLTPLQINLIITFAQSALTWQIYRIPYMVGCPHFGDFSGKISSSQILIGFSSLIKKMTSFFNYDIILKCHLADFMQILTYLENDKSLSDQTCMKMTRRVDFLSRLFTRLSSNCNRKQVISKKHKFFQKILIFAVCLLFPYKALLNLVKAVLNLVCSYNR